MELRGRRVIVRPATSDDVDALTAIRETAEVRRWWRGDDVRAETVEHLADDEVVFCAIEADGVVVGAIQWHEEEDPEYRHAGLDIYVDPRRHRQGIGLDAIRTVAQHLIDELGHHRLTIDPAADNAAAIACYERAGFRPVGVMRSYERGADGTWHDGLLMDLLADQFVDDAFVDEIDDGAGADEGTRT